jgi:hypothetical protein
MRPAQAGRGVRTLDFIGHITNGSLEADDFNLAVSDAEYNVLGFAVTATFCSFAFGVLAHVAAHAGGAQWPSVTVAMMAIGGLIPVAPLAASLAHKLRLPSPDLRADDTQELPQDKVVQRPGGQTMHIFHWPAGHSARHYRSFAQAAMRATASKGRFSESDITSYSSLGSTAYDSVRKSLIGEGYIEKLAHNKGHAVTERGKLAFEELLKL